MKSGSGHHGPATGHVDGRRHHLTAVADDLLPWRVPPPVQAQPAAVAVYAAAPGRCDTSAVLATLLTSSAESPHHDLGGTVGQRLERWERQGQIVPRQLQGAVLLWCPVDQEGPAVASAMVLGRLGALLQPRCITLLWFASGPSVPGRAPAARQQQRVQDLTRAAVPGAEIRLHCLGWRSSPEGELQDLARRFA